MGQRGGLDPAHRPTPLRQRPARGHQRHPRRPGAVVTPARGRTTSPPPSAPANATAGQWRSSTPSTWPRASPRGCAGHHPRLPRPAHGDDPRHRPGLSHGNLRWRGGVRRVLGRQDPHRPASPAAPPPSMDDRHRSCPVDSRPHRGRQVCRGPHQQPGSGDGVGGLARCDDRLRPQDPRLHLAGVALALGALADPRVLGAVSPGPGEDFDPATFLQARGTLYLLATGAGAGASAALVAAFVETSSRPHAASPHARPAHVSIHRCCWRWMRSATSPPCPRCRR